MRVLSRYCSRTKGRRESNDGSRFELASMCARIPRGLSCDHDAMEIIGGQLDLSSPRSATSVMAVANGYMVLISLSAFVFRVERRFA